MNHLAVLSQLHTLWTEPGYAVLDDVLPDEVLCRLDEKLETLSQQHALRPASIGKSNLESNLRGDWTYWLSESEEQGLGLKDFFSDFQQVLKEEFWIPIHRHECHFAVYPPQKGYTKHIDQIHGSQARALSFVLYLSPSWDERDGGELVMYDPHSPEKVLLRLSPRRNRLVVFRGDQIPHEVRPALRSRKSLTGWQRYS